MCSFFTEFIPQTPKINNQDGKSIRIVFLLTLNGRALRQVYRLINTLYRKNHYFYIHIDKVSKLCLKVISHLYGFFYSTFLYLILPKLITNSFLLYIVVYEYVVLFDNQFQKSLMQRPNKNV